MTIVSHFIPIHGTKQGSIPNSKSLFDNELWMNVHDSMLGSRTTTNGEPQLVEFAQLTPEERKQLQSILNTYIEKNDSGFSVDIARASDLDDVIDNTNKNIQAINDKLAFDSDDTTTVAEKFAAVNKNIEAANENINNVEQKANTADNRVTQLKNKVNKSIIFKNSDKIVVGGQLNCQYHEDTQTLSLNIDKIE